MHGPGAYHPTMFAHVVAWYARRIVNVNINIILAGVLALIPVTFIARLAEHLLSTGLVKNHRLQAHHALAISAVTLVTDIILDVGIYFVLHWLASHVSKRIPAMVEQRIEGVADAAAESVPFFKDAAKVQLQRAVLSPLLYILWLGSQFVFINVAEWSAAWATVVGFCIAIGTVRTIHTFWMLKEERKARARLFVAGLPSHANTPSCGLVVPERGVAAPSLNGRAGDKAAAPQSLSENGEKSVLRS
jgi:hypothetical protein